MSHLEINFNIKEKIKECIAVYNANNKKTPMDENTPLRGVFYTDGGSRDFAGWGVHGYIFNDHETNSNSSCKKAVPTKEGYKTSSKTDKASVVGYLDYHGYLDKDASNNVAEITAMIKLLNLLPILNTKSNIILADSMYVLTLLTDREKYINNNFINSQGKPLANTDLVKELIFLFKEISTKHEITLKHVKGHSGDYGNDRADELCTAAIHYRRNKERDALPEQAEEYENSFFKLTDPETYFVPKLEVNKLLTESNLFLVTDRQVTHTPNVYHQATFGHMMKSLNAEEKREVRGKPFSDMCISVVRLNETDEVLDKLSRIAQNIFTLTGVVDFNLKHVTRANVYFDLISGHLNYLDIDNVNNKVTDINKTDVVTLLNPPRLAYRLSSNFEIVEAMLSEITSGNKAGNFIFVKDLTPILFDMSQVDKKGNTIYKATLPKEDRFTVPVSFENNGVRIECELPLMLSIDLPNKISISRLKNINPKIELFVFDVGPRSFRYATYISTDSGVGIWMGIFSNLHLLK